MKRKDKERREALHRQVELRRQKMEKEKREDPNYSALQEWRRRDASEARRYNLASPETKRRIRREGRRAAGKDSTSPKTPPKKKSTGRFGPAPTVFNALEELGYALPSSGGRRPKRGAATKKVSRTKDLREAKKTVQSRLGILPPRRTALEKLGIELARLVSEQDSHTDKANDYQKRVLRLVAKINGRGGGGRGRKSGSGSGSGGSGSGTTPMKEDPI
jgi:hypothetical protein